MKAQDQSVNRVVVASTVMLSLSPSGEQQPSYSVTWMSAYYAGGIARLSRKSAPWFILGIMLFSYAVRAVYIESCTMFVRGACMRRA